MPYIKHISPSNLKTDIPQLKSGMTVKVHQKIRETTGEGKNEKTKDRIQVFEGQIIAVKHGRGLNASFTVRRIASGVGVERVFPMHSPAIAKIEVTKNLRAKKSKIYYTREGVEAKLFEMKKSK